MTAFGNDFAPTDINAAVQDGILIQGNGGGLDQEGHEGQLDTCRLQHGVQLLPDLYQLSNVKLVTIAKVRYLQGCCHGLGHGLGEDAKVGLSVFGDASTG